MKLPRVLVTATAAPAVSLGRAQRTLAVDSVLPLRKRTSGGGAVLLGPCLLRALVALPAGHEQVRRGPAAAARWFGDVHCRWLRHGGIEALPHAGPTIDHWACFAGRSAGEVLVDGRKITGIAQTWHRNRVLLWSATLLAPAPWQMLCMALRRPLGEAQLLEAGTANAQACLGRSPEPRAWATDLEARLREVVTP